MRLFIRSNQGMVLTDEGELLYAALEPLYQAIDKSIRSVKDISASPVKVLRLIAPTAYDFSEAFLPIKEIVRAYEKCYPGVVLDERLCEFSDMRKALEFGEADLAISEDFVLRDMDNIMRRRLIYFNLYLAISAEHPLAQSDTMDFSKLSNETVFTIPTLNDEKRDIEAQLGACHHLGFNPKKVEFKPNFQTIFHAVSHGKGISICFKFISFGSGQEVKYYPVELPVRPCIVVAWKVGRLSREARNFIEMLPEPNLPQPIVNDQEDV